MVKPQYRKVSWRDVGFGENYRPTPSSIGGKPVKLYHEHEAKDKVGFKDESQFVHCKNCGFICKKGRDSACPFCGTENYAKVSK